MLKKIFITVLSVLFLLSLSAPIFADGDGIPEPPPAPTLPGGN